MIHSLKNQFLHDLKASWPKTLLLAILLAVGLFFWIPPLVRAVSGPEQHTRSGNNATRAATVPSTVAKEVDVPHSNGSSRSITWEKADEILKSDPLVRSAEVAAIQGNPFRLSPDQFSPPILFADAEPEVESHPVSAPNGAKANAAQTAKSNKPGSTNSKTGATAPNPGSGEQAAGTIDGLTLKSTILGDKRRAALINDKLYSEGSEIQLDGVSYLLTLVRPREVHLKRGEQTYVLALPGAVSASSIRVEKVERQPAP